MSKNEKNAFKHECDDCSVHVQRRFIARYCISIVWSAWNINISSHIISRRTIRISFKRNRIWLDMGVSWNRTIPMVFYKRDISMIWPIKINHLFLSYSLCWVETTQCSVPGRRCCQCWCWPAWQRDSDMCVTQAGRSMRPPCQVSRVTCHEMLLTLPPHRGWRHPAPCSGHLNSQIKHQTYGLSWLQHCSNEAGACSSAVLPTFILKYIKVKHVL